MENSEMQLRLLLKHFLVVYQNSKVMDFIFSHVCMNCLENYFNHCEMLVIKKN